MENGSWGLENGSWEMENVCWGMEKAGYIPTSRLGQLVHIGAKFKFLPISLPHNQGQPETASTAPVIRQFMGRNAQAVVATDSLSPVSGSAS